MAKTAPSLNYSEKITVETSERIIEEESPEEAPTEGITIEESAE